MYGSPGPLWGHDVRQVNTSRAGLKEAFAYRPDFVLLDIGMPMMDGCELARQLRLDRRLLGCFIVAITATGTLSSAVDAMKRASMCEQRRKTAQHQKALAGTDVKPNQATAKPASAVEDEIAIVGISLTPEQELAADRLQEKYLSHLRSLNRDIQGLHTRLVSLEADKLVELENVLTKEQLSQLHEFRQNAPVAPKVAASRATPAKTK